MRFVSLGLCVLLGALTSAQAQQPKSRSSTAPLAQESHQPVSVETRPQLFVVLCALDAAGFDSGANTTNDTPGRVQLRRQPRLLLLGLAVRPDPSLRQVPVVRSLP